jgi:hypothetical protein
MPKKMNVKVP